MLGTAGKKIRRWFKEIKQARHQRQREKLAKLAEIEEKERKALVIELTKKLSAAHVYCKQNKKTVASIELSAKEILFLEGCLKTWSRYFKEHKIYKPVPLGNGCLYDTNSLRNRAMP